MSKTPVQLRQLTQLPARNLIINGNFDFWQRNTSFALGSSSIFLADRYGGIRPTGNTCTVTRDTSVPTQDEANFQSVYSLKYTNGTGATVTSNLYNLFHRIEGFDYQTFHSKPVRLQFWVKSSLAGVYGLAFKNNDSTRSYPTSYTINSPNTWEKKTIDLVTDSTGTWLFDNGVGFQVSWSLGHGAVFNAPSLNQWHSADYRGPASYVDWAGTTGATWQIAQVSLVSGDFSGLSFDIPFVRAGNTIQQELAMCQRYTYALASTGNNYQFASGHALNTTLGMTSVRFPVTMRSAPSVTIPSGVAASDFKWDDGITSVVLSAVPVSALTPSGDTTVITGTVASGLTAFRPYNLLAASANAKIIFEAEL